MRYLLFLFLLISFHGISQQTPLTSFYWNNYSFFNPAMSGVAHKHEANVIWRNQWEKVNGAPNNLFVNYAINLADKHGLGVNYMYETIGFTGKNQVKLNYNYQLKLDDHRKLVLGTAIDFQHIQVTNDWIPPTTINDPLLPTSSQTSLLNVDVGVSYFGNRITAGLSMIQLPAYTGSSYYDATPHLYGNFRYKAELFASSKLIFETQLRTDFIKYSQDINIGYNWKEILEAGIGYRTSDAILFNLTGIIAKKYRVGYMYDLTINKLSSISRGSHEITLGMRIGK